jgi:demethylmenaquinone methyltransferase/2-methoxy-6-polyprenyl-1,4-benzoquinol methylase
MEKNGSDAPVARPPHPALTGYYRGAADKDAFVREMFDSTAGDYDRVERILALGTGAWYRGQALARAGLQPGMRVVDVGVGTGLVASAAARLVGNAGLVTGIDPCANMLRHARVPAGVNLVGGRAEEIPCADATFDFLSMGYALRHVSDLSVAFAEFHRVLKPGGRLCVLEISAPRSAVGRALLRAYLRTLVPLLALLVGRQRNTRRLWQYYWDTIETCLPPEQIAQALRAAGFDEVRVHNDVKALTIFSEFQGRKPLVGRATGAA